eukprot:scaffold132040_cov57-Phaeocystis_antarctica.AAC.1
MRLRVRASGLCCTLIACSVAASGERRQPSARPAAVPPEPAATMMWSKCGSAAGAGGGCGCICAHSSRTASMRRAAHRDDVRAAALGGELRGSGGVDPVHRAQVAAIPEVIARRAEVQLRAEQPLDQQVAREANLVRVRVRVRVRPTSVSISRSRSTRTRCGSSPTSRAAAAVARQWFDCTPARRGRGINRRVGVRVRVKTRPWMGVWLPNVAQRTANSDHAVVPARERLGHQELELSRLVA